MEGILSIKEKMQEMYGNHTLIVKKVCQFVLAYLCFYLINKNIGFMGAAASPVVTLGLSVVCVFFPLTFTVFVGAGLILAHMYALSLGYLAATAVLFLLMFIFYFRMTPELALVILLTPVAFWLHMPFVVPIACALLLTPISMVASACGIITYFMLECAKAAAPTLSGEEVPAITDQITGYMQQVFQNKEMWVYIFAMVIGFMVAYVIRNTSMNHAWKIAIVTGSVVNMIVCVAGGLALRVTMPMANLFVGAIVSSVVGLIFEIFYFSVDYTGTENLQYEDDDYYYYVKAVPKIKVTKEEKNVKTINERRDTEVMEAEEVKKSAPKKRKARPIQNTADVDRQLLERSMRKEFPNHKKTTR